MHFVAEAWKLVTPICIRNSFLMCGSPFDHVSKNDNALRLGAGEQNGVVCELLECDLRIM